MLQRCSFPQTKLQNTMLGRSHPPVLWTVVDHLGYVGSKVRGRWYFAKPQSPRQPARPHWRPQEQLSHTPAQSMQAHTVYSVRIVEGKHGNPHGTFRPMTTEGVDFDLRAHKTTLTRHLSQLFTSIAIIQESPMLHQFFSSQNCYCYKFYNKILFPYLIRKHCSCCSWVAEVHKCVLVCGYGV